MTKIRKSSLPINPHGGVHFAMKAVEQSGISSIIYAYLGKRVKQAEFSYSDLILSWIRANLCGADRLEDVHQMNHNIRGNPHAKRPGPDVIGKVFKKLAKPNTNIIDKNSLIEHQINTNQRMNMMLLESLVSMKLINPRDMNNVMDIDHSIIPCEKKGAGCSFTYVSGLKGYQPCTSFINNIPFYIQGQGGNSPARFKIVDIIKRSVDNLRMLGVTPSKIRSDAAAYQIEVVDYLDDEGIEFFIRAKITSRITYEMTKIQKWTPGRIAGYDIETGSLFAYAFGGKKLQRYVITRFTQKDGNYKYRAIITSNHKWDEMKIVNFYNKRGAVERVFDELKNSFCWSNLPFSYLDENVVFLIISAMAYGVFKYVVRKFAKKTKWVKRNWRLKNFIFHFLTVPALWLDYDTLKVFSERDYGEL